MKKGKKQEDEKKKGKKQEEKHEKKDEKRENLGNVIHLILAGGKYENGFIDSALYDILHTDMDKKEDVGDVSGIRVCRLNVWVCQVASDGFIMCTNIEIVKLAYWVCLSLSKWSKYVRHIQMGIQFYGDVESIRKDETIMSLLYTCKQLVPHFTIRTQTINALLEEYNIDEDESTFEFTSPLTVMSTDYDSNSDNEKDDDEYTLAMSLIST